MTITKTQLVCEVVLILSWHGILYHCGYILKVQWFLILFCVATLVCLGLYVHVIL